MESEQMGISQRDGMGCQCDRGGQRHDQGLFERCGHAALRFDPEGVCQQFCKFAFVSAIFTPSFKDKYITLLVNLVTSFKQISHKVWFGMVLFLHRR